MFCLRSCPRCQGDLYQDGDVFGYYLRCLQCGHEVHLARRLEGQEGLRQALLAAMRLPADPSLLMAQGSRGRPGRYRKALRVA